MRIGALVVIIAMAVGAALLARDGILLERNARVARRALAHGRVSEARQLIDGWLRVQPRSAEAHFLKARVALAEGDSGEASRQLTLARELGYSRFQLERINAIIKAQSGKYAEAEPVLTRIFRQAQEPDPEVDEALALVYLRTYRLSQAQQVLDRWLHDAPNDAKPYLWYTEVDSRTTDDDTSNQESHFRAALARDPNLDRARIGLAELLRKATRNREASVEFALYLERNPNDVAANVGAGLCALEEDDEDSAVRFLDRALALGPDNPSALRSRATIDRRHGHYVAALERLNRAVDADANDTETLYARQLTLARLGRTVEAHADKARLEKLKDDQARLLKMRDALAADPNNVPLRCEIARWMFAHGRDDEGKRWAEHILALQPKYEPANRLMEEYCRRTGDIGLANYYRLQAPPDSMPRTP
jgi:predicted Zn-dependent protease